MFLSFHLLCPCSTRSLFYFRCWIYIYIFSVVHSLSHYKCVPGGFGRKYAICMIYHHCTDIWAKWLVGGVWLRNSYMYDIYIYVYNMQLWTGNSFENNWWLSKDIRIVSNKKETSVSSLFESIRWLREPAREERLFGLSVWRPEVVSCHRFIMSSYNHVIMSSCYGVVVSQCYHFIPWCPCLSL